MKVVGPPESEANYYKLPRPGLLWNGFDEPPLDADGGLQHRERMKARTLREETAPYESTPDDSEATDVAEEPAAAEVSVSIEEQEDISSTPS